MRDEKYFSFESKPAGPAPIPAEPADSRLQIIWLDEGMIPGTIFGETAWYVRPFKGPGIHTHDSDELLVFMGSDHDNAWGLGGVIELNIGDDRYVIERTCALYVPKGVPHGDLNVKRIDRPLLHFTSLTDRGTYEAKSAVLDGSLKGRYTGYMVDSPKQAEDDFPGIEKFMLRTLWMDTEKLEGAPYMEAVWFRQKTTQGPEPHMHDFPEFLGFFGSDPEDPYDLKAEVEFTIGDERFVFTKSCLVFVPEGLMHCPLLLPRCDRPIIHFSGGPGRRYSRLQ